MRRQLIGIAWWTATLAGCVLGEPEEPGCVEDTECGEGQHCRAGACFEDVPGSAFVPADGGADGDAGAGADGDAGP